MGEYNRCKTYVRKFLIFFNFKQSIINYYDDCLSSFEHYLNYAKKDFSPELLNDWINSDLFDISEEFNYSFDIFCSRLKKAFYSDDENFLYDMCEFSPHLLLKGNLKKQLEEFLFSIDGKVNQTNYSGYRRQCSLFLIYANRRHNINDIKDIGVDLMKEYHDSVNLSKHGMTNLRYMISELMKYFFNRNIVDYINTIFYHYYFYGKEPCWLINDDNFHSSIKTILDKENVYSLNDILCFLEKLKDVLNHYRYNKRQIAAYESGINLLIMFLSYNGYSYVPDVGLAWVNYVTSTNLNLDESLKRYVYLLNDYLVYGTIDLSKMYQDTSKFKNIPSWCKKAAFDYVDLKIKEKWSYNTITMIKSSILRFCNYIDSIGIRSYKEITAEHIKEFNLHDKHRTPQGKNAYNSRIKKFLIYLGENNYLNNSFLFLALNTVTAPKETMVTVLNEDERKKLKEAIESDESLTLRNKAILLLGTKMGIRGIDIVNLKYENINWKDSSIRFIQSKTKVEVNLPMPVEVGNALYKYISEERKKCDDDHVFIVEKGPCHKVNRHVCNASLKKALPNKKLGYGFHITRRTYATDLLRNGVGYKDVATALGQVNTSSVNRYLSLDDEKMIKCTLSCNSLNINEWRPL